MLLDFSTLAPSALTLRGFQIGAPRWTATSVMRDLFWVYALWIGLAGLVKRCAGSVWDVETYYPRTELVFLDSSGSARVGLGFMLLFTMCVKFVAYLLSSLGLNGLIPRLLASCLSENVIYIFVSVRYSRPPLPSIRLSPPFEPTAYLESMGIYAVMQNSHTRARLPEFVVRSWICRWEVDLVVVRD